MKRFIALLLVALIAVSLVACSMGKNDTGAGPGSSTNSGGGNNANEGGNANNSANNTYDTQKHIVVTRRKQFIYNTYDCKQDSK